MGGIVQIQEMDMIGNGIDFHCSNMIEDILPQVKFKVSRWMRDNGHDCDLESALKSCIWHYNSKPTSKISLFEISTKNCQSHITPEHVRFWDLIKTEVVSYQKRMLRSRLRINSMLVL